jgi:hypothetical protein
MILSRSLCLIYRGTKGLFIHEKVLDIELLSSQEEVRLKLYSSFFVPIN